MKHKHLNLFIKYITFLLVTTSLLSLIVGVNAEIKTKQKNISPAKDSFQEYSLKNIRVEESKDKIEIIIENSHLPQYVTFPLSDPSRIVINVINAAYNCPENKIIVNKNNVICIRSSQFKFKPFKISRVVIDLDKELKYQVSSKENDILISLEKDNFLNLGKVSSIDIKENKDWIVAEITAFKEVPYKTFTLSDPERIVLDLEEVILNLKQREIKIGKLNIDKIRLSPYREDKEEKIVRIVFDLTEKVPYKIERIDNIIKVFLGNIKKTQEEKVEVIKESSKIKKEETILPEVVKAEISEKERTVLPKVGEKLKTKKTFSEEDKKVQVKEEIKKETEENEAKEKIEEANKEKLLREETKRINSSKREKVELTGIKGLIGRESEISPEEVLISMDFRNANIIDVLRIISYKVGVNIVPSQEVKGKVTIKLDNVSWRNALSVLLQAYGYSFVEEGSIVRVDSKEKLLKEAVITKVFVLSYADAKMLAESLKNMLTVGIGSINIDTRVNAIIITDNFKVVNGLSEIINKLDSRASQVLIEAKIIEVTLSDEEKLGIKWTTKPSGLKEDVSGEVGVEFSTDSPNIKDSGYLNIGTIQRGFNINAQISALIQEGKLDVLSNPRIVALNGQEAKIIAGEDVPYKTITMGEGGTSSEQVSFKEVGIKLVVTPTINPNKYITLKIHPEVSDVKEWKYEMPIISKRESDSLVLVRDGETVVVGGLIKDKKITTKYGVPYLRKIPLIGRLFKKKFITDQKTELLIFITPKVIIYDSK